MTDTTQHNLALPRNLGNGLVLRQAAARDVDELVEFNARIHSDDGPERPDIFVGAWTRDLLTKPHPTLKPQDFTLVEDTQTGKIVSSLCLISQTWSYEGIRFGFGRPELVGTAEAYRNRGLVRAQIEAVHGWSAQRGELAQGITGIPFYYRQFGYEMTVDIGGGMMASCAQIPKLKPGEEEPYRVRPALEADIAWMDQLYRRSCQRYVLSCEWDESLWRYELLVKDRDNVNRSELRIIESQDGQAVGFLAYWSRNLGDRIAASRYELLPGVSYGAVTPGVLRYLCATGQANAQTEAAGGEIKPCNLVVLLLGQDHPAYQAMPSVLSQKRRSYAWYMRVPDLPAFLQHISPVLEARLAASSFAGHSGELKITFYRSGLLLGFEQGRLVKAEHWKPQPLGHSGDAGFPNLTFLHLLFGHRSPDELRHLYVDCWWEHDSAYGLLNALFPRKPSLIWPIA